MRAARRLAPAAVTASVAAAVGSTACGAPCQEIGAQFGLTELNMNRMADAFLASQKKYPNGGCGPNTPNSVDQCLRITPDALADLSGLVCNRKATADRDSSTNPLAPLTSQQTSVWIRLVPGLSLDGQMSAGATVKAFCDYTVFHRHDGSGPAQAGPDPDVYLDRAVIANVDFELRAVANTDVTYVQNGVPKSQTINAGSACRSDNYLFKGCRYARDGLACNVAGTVTDVRPDAGVPLDGPREELPLDGPREELPLDGPREEVPGERPREPLPP